MTRSRAVLAATSLAVVLLVAGCDTDAPAAPSPQPVSTASSPDSSPTPSATAVVVKPERPEAMNDDGPAGAEAAAVYFEGLDSYIMKTGDTAEWKAMSHKSCETCAARLAQAKKIAKNGDIFEGGDATTRLLHTYEQDASTGIWPLDLEVQTKAATITNTGGEVVASFEPERYKVRAEVARSHGQWVIIGIYDLDDK